jgi:hypothetical protein
VGTALSAYSHSSATVPRSRELTALVEGEAKRRRMRLQQHVRNGDLAPQVGPRPAAWPRVIVLPLKGAMARMAEVAGLAGKRLLVVEDEYMIPRDVARALEGAGAQVVGPVGTVALLLARQSSCVLRLRPPAACILLI